MSATTRQKLVDRAEYLTRRHGYNGFSFSDLSDHIGIRKASINYYFPHKTDLLLEMMQGYRERFGRALDGIDAKHRLARPKLKAYVEMNRHALDGGQSMCLYVSLGLTVEGLDGKIIEELREFHAQSIDWLQALHQLGRIDQSLPSHGDARAWANQTLSSLQGAQVSARVTGRLEAFNLVAKRILTCAT
ncbi:MAG: TetR/AcrR family transcriptional regulator [Planctomycetota bacterium]